jgi:hypothetical protein
MLVHALHAPLEDGEATFDRVGVELATRRHSAGRFYRPPKRCFPDT